MKIALPALAVMFLFSCATPQKDAAAEQPVKQELQVVKTVKEGVLLEKSGETPSWKTQSHFQAGGRHYFVGSSYAAQDKEDARHKAASQAFALISKFVNVKVKSQVKSYEERISGTDAEFVQSSLDEVGAEIKLKNYEEEDYFEKWERTGTQQHDAFVKISIADSDMKVLEIERDGITAWFVQPGNSCGIKNEFDSFIKEIGSKKGWKISPAPIALSGETDMKAEFDNPKTAYLLAFKPECKIIKEGDAWKTKAVFAVEHYSLTEKRTAHAFSAECSAAKPDEPESKTEAFNKCKGNLAQKLFSYAGAVFTPQLPDVKAESSLSQVDIAVLQLLEKAQQADKEGWLFPKKAIAAWKPLAEKDGNPYAASAGKRIELWEKYIQQRTDMEAKMQEDREKLKKVLALGVMGLDEKAKFLKEYLYNYGAVYGVQDMVDLIGTVKPETEIAKLKAAVFTRELLEEWKSACESNDGAACYFFGSASDKPMEKYLVKACDSQIGAACLSLSKKYTALESGRKAIDYATKACSYGQAKGCFSAGNIYYTGRCNIDIDMPKAVSFFETACEADEVGGCAYLGWIYEKGESVKKDEKKAAEYYLKACNLGYAKSCQKLGK